MVAFISVFKQNFSGNRKRVYKSFSSRQPSRKSFVLTIPGSLAKLVKSIPRIIVHLSLTVQKQMGVLKRAVRRVKEGTSAVLLQSGLDENWWADSMECYTYLRNVQDLSYLMG